MISNYFIIQVEDLNTLDSGKIKSLVIDNDLFKLANQLMGTEIHKSRKLIIMTDSNPHDFFFEGGFMKHFSEFIPMNISEDQIKEKEINDKKLLAHLEVLWDCGFD